MFNSFDEAFKIVEANQVANAVAMQKLLLDKEVLVHDIVKLFEYDLAQIWYFR